nr:MAG TPA: hypothetical protein [Caudoviricetes sp.]
MQFVAYVANYLLLIKNNKYMYNGVHTHTRKKHEYAYIYVYEKKQQYRQHNPDEASIHIGSSVLPIIY